MIAFLLIVVFAQFYLGIINRTRAVCAGRRGYRFFQPQMTVAVLLRKGAVYSTGSTVITRLAPLVYLATVVVVAMLMPLGEFGALISFRGDVVVFVYLLGLGRLAMVWGALDSGSSFQGMGSARELFFGMLGEPAMLLLLGTLALMTGNDSFTSIFAKFDNQQINIFIVSLLVGYGFLKLALLECGRVPVDDPRTHLELTMIHEAMILDLSGVDLAFVQIAGWLKMAVFGMLVANALIPATVAGWALVGCYISIQLLFAVFVGVMESFRARNRMSRNATYVATVLALGVLAFVVAYILKTNVLDGIV